MTSSISVLKRALSLACVVLSLAAAAPLCAQSVNPKVAKYSSDPNAEKIDLKLLELSKKGTTQASRLISRAPDGQGILVEVICNTFNDDVLGKFALPGITVRESYPQYQRVIISAASADDLVAVSAIPEVGLIRPVIQPAVLSSGVADSRADRALFADRVLQRVITGAGQKIGVISDSFAQSTGVRDEDTFPAIGFAGTLTGSRPQDSGDLPPTVEILRDDQIGDGSVDQAGSDEGAGMAELIHDIAPGAAISFHTGFGGEALFADAINRLREAGCTIITDDLIYFAEPMYQHGIVAQAALLAVQAGIPFFSAAGNSGDLGIRQNYQDINPRKDDKILPSTDDENRPYLGNDLHDWGGSNGFLPVFLPANSQVNIILQWNQPYFSVTPSPRSGAKIDLDLYVTATPTVEAMAEPVAESRNPQGFGRTPLGDPFEIITLENGGAGRTVFIAIDHYNGSQKGIPQNKKTRLEFRLVFITSDPLQVQGIGLGGTSAGGPTIFGHALADGVAAVGAVPWWESPAFNPGFGATTEIDPELFTSRGGSFRTLFDVRGKWIRKQNTVFAPNFCAVDGNNTTFFGSPDEALPAELTSINYQGEPDGFPNFFGTSAAAPNAAAVGALLREQNPGLGPNDLNNLLANTAIDVKGWRAAPGFDDVSGHGLINANGIIEPGQLSNLTFNQPGGWSSTLVINQLAGSRTDATTIDVAQNVYVNFSVINTGLVVSGRTTTAQIKVDGIVNQEVNIPALAPGQSTEFTDISLGLLPAGQHTVEVVIDPLNVISEANEGDNTVSKTILVSAEANLAFTQPNGWPSPVIINQTFGDLAEPALMNNTQPVYVNYAITNNGVLAVTTPFDVRVYVDGGLVNTFNVASLAIGGVVEVRNVDIGVLTAGSHTVRIVIDEANAVLESSEADNETVRTISIGSSPSNNNLAGAAFISNLCAVPVVQANNFYATKEAGEPFHAGNRGGSSVWYWFVSPVTARITIDTIGSDFNTLLAVYTGNTFATLQLVAANDDIVLNTNVQSSVEFEATAGTVYVIAVDGFNGVQGNLVLNTSLSVSNDNFAAATILPANGTIETINHCASKEACEPNHAGNAGGRSLWFRWTAPSTGSALFTTAGSRIDTLLAVYTGTSLCGGLTEIASNDDLSLNPPDRDSYVTFPVTGGVEYFIAVDGFNAEIGNITLTWSAGPSNDFFGSASVLSNTLNGGCGFPSSNVGAGIEPGEPEFSGIVGGASVWFRWTAPAKGILTSYPVTFDTFGSDFDTILAILKGTSIQTATVLAVNNNASGVAGAGWSRVTFNAEVGETYFILVDGNNGAEGNILLNWDDGFAPDNDLFVNAFPVPAASGQALCSETSQTTLLASTKGATLEVGEPDHAFIEGKRSVWYKLVVADSSTSCPTGTTRQIRVQVTADPGDPQFDPIVGVYTGGGVGGLSTYASQDDITPGSNTNVDLTFIAPPGTYYVAVDGKFCTSGRFELIVTNAPAPVLLPPPPGR